MGLIAYQVPLARVPNTYNGQPLWYAALASQKNYMSVYLMTVYGDKGIEKWFRERFKVSGKKLDMGKSCVHFRKLEDLPLDVIGETIARVPLEAYVSALRSVPQEVRLAGRRELLGRLPRATCTWL